MKQIYKNAICFMTLGILCGCDAGVLPRNFNEKEKDAYCIGVITHLYSNNFGQEGGLNLLTNLSLAWVRKYNEINAVSAKQYLVKGVSDIRYYCYVNNVQDNCNRITNVCNRQLEDLTQIAERY